MGSAEESGSVLTEHCESVQAGAHIRRDGSEGENCRGTKEARQRRGVSRFTGGASRSLGADPAAAERRTAAAPAHRPLHSREEPQTEHVHTVLM